MTIYIQLCLFLSRFAVSPLFHVQFCYFLTCIQSSQEAGQVVWDSHLFKNFPPCVGWLLVPSATGREARPPVRSARRTPATCRSSLPGAVESRLPSGREGAGSPAGSGRRDGGSGVRVGSLCEAGCSRLPHPAAGHQPWLQVTTCRRARLVTAYPAPAIAPRPLWERTARPVDGRGAGAGRAAASLRARPEQRAVPRLAPVSVRRVGPRRRGRVRAAYSV